MVPHLIAATYAWSPPNRLNLRFPFVPVRSYRDLPALRSEYSEKEDRISARLEEFRRVGSRNDERLFEELCFCLLAIQTKARAADAAVKALAVDDLLWAGELREIAPFQRRRIRFHNHKAAYIVRARERFFPPGGPGLRKSLEGLGDAKPTRAWLVREVDGLGWKEASHFLRNIGRGDGLAILDRHILRNLQRHGVIRRMPGSLTPKRYLQIEGRMESFSEDVEISMAALDLLFWSRETGEIFK